MLNIGTTLMLISNRGDIYLRDPGQLEGFLIIPGRFIDYEEVTFPKFSRWIRSLNFINEIESFNTKIAQKILVLSLAPHAVYVI